MKTSLSAAALASLLLIVLGCSSSGSDSNTSDTGIPDAGTPTGACAELAAVVRDNAKECAGGRASAQQAEFFARYERFCVNHVNAPGSGLSSDVLNRCITKIRGLCADDEACEELEELRGTLPEGAACDIGYQCVSGRCHSEGTSDEQSGCGKCVALVPIGSPCTSGGCVSGAACKSIGGGAATCAPVRTVGEGASCDESNTNEAVRCAEGLKCIRTGTTHTCRPYAKSGEACGDIPCELSLVCISGRCASRQAAGAACTSPNQCQSGLSCDEATKKCAAIIWSRTGEACDRGVRRCERGFCHETSSGSSGTCIDYVADGAACDPQNPMQRCNIYAICQNGTCQFTDPARCK